MGMPRRRRRANQRTDAGFSLAGLVVALGLFALAAALSVAVLGNAYRSAALLSTSIERRTDANSAIGYITSTLTYSSKIVTASGTQIVTLNDENGICVEHTFAISASKVSHVARSYPTPPGVYCRDLSAAAWNDTFPLASVKKEVLVWGVDTGTSAFVYYGPANASLGVTPAPCAVTRVSIRIATKGAQGTPALDAGSASIARRSMGGDC